MTRRRRLVPSLAAVLLLAGACTRTPHPVPEPQALKPSRANALPRLGYTLQAGAFSKAENAARVSVSLQAHGLEATYYASGDGFYRVRFGDFATKEKARERGEALKGAGLIEAFWVVAPDGTAPGASGRSRPIPRRNGGFGPAWWILPRATWAFRTSLEARRSGGSIAVDSRGRSTG